MKNFLNAFLQVFPLLVLLFYRRFHGDMTDDLWQQAFYMSSACAVAVTIFCLYKNIILDRFRLGISLFLVLGALAFSCNIESVLLFYQEYSGVAFFAGIFAIGITTTFFSPLGFLGIYTDNLQELKKASLCLLGAVVIATCWSFFMNEYGTLVSIVMPFIGLRFLRKFFINRLKMNKV